MTCGSRPSSQFSTLVFGIFGLTILSALIGSGCSGNGSTDSNRDDWIVRQPVLEGNNLRGAWFVDDQTGWCVGTGGVVLHTQDGGTAWAEQTSGTAAALSAVQFLNADLGWAVGAGGCLLRTGDGGRSWRTAVAPTTTEDVTALRFVSDRKGFAVTEGGRFLYTFDGGYNWTEDIVNTYANLWGLAVYDTVALVVGSDGLIARGIDYEVTTANFITDTVWISWAGRPSTTTLTLRSVAFAAAGNVWAVGDSGIMLHSSDTGLTWAEGAPRAGDDLLAVRFRSASVGLAVGRNGLLLMTDDGGVSWVRRDVGVNFDLYDVATAPSGAVWTVGELTILRSTDGGGIWTLQPSGTPVLPTMMDITFPDAGHGFAVGHGGLIMSTSDGGESWVTLRRGARLNPTEWFRAVRFLDARHGWVAGMTGPPYFERGVLLHTDDGGFKWTVRVFNDDTPPSFDRVRDFVFVDSSVGYILSRTEVYKTTDGGVVWEPTFIPTITALNTICFPYADTGWAAGDNGVIYKTVNGGRNWTDQTPLIMSGDLQEMVCIDSLRGWLVGANGLIWRTVDGGQLWTRQTSGTSSDLMALEMLDSLRGYAAGVGGVILATEDGGETWVRQSCPVSSALNGLGGIDGGSVWTVGDFGVLLESTADSR